MPDAWFHVSGYIPWLIIVSGAIRLEYERACRDASGETIEKCRDYDGTFESHVEEKYCDNSKNMYFV